MREILFRGKRMDNGEWVEAASILRTVDGGVYIADKGWTSAINKLPGGRLMIPIAYHQVDPDTVGQYTGLTDRNGRKVFEGDILKFTDASAGYEWVGRVEFGNPNAGYRWGFQLVYLEGEKANTDILMWFDMEEAGAYAEVIGNIHDEPELLDQ